MNHKTMRTLLFILLIQQGCISQSTGMVKKIASWAILAAAWSAAYLSGYETAYNGSEKLKAAELSALIEIERNKAINETISRIDCQLKRCERNLRCCDKHVDNLERIKL